MSELFLRLHGLLEEGTYGILVPLILVCFFLWVLVVERTFYLFGSAWSRLWPPARAKARERRARLNDALEEYIESSTQENRNRLLIFSRMADSPYSRFILRVIGGEGLLSPAIRDLQLAEAALRSQQEIEKNLSVISMLSKVAPLIGLLGTVTGMIHTFSAMMVASTSDPRALSSGVSMALIATEVGLIVALPGVLSMTWLSRRAQAILEEINLVSMRFKQVGLGPRRATA